MSVTPIPQLASPPLIGNIREFQTDRLGLFMRISRDLGDIGLFRVGPWPVVMLNSPAYARAILVDHAAAVERPPRIRAIQKPLLGNGILYSTNSDHQHQRRLIAPAFQRHHISTYADTMVEYVQAQQFGWHDSTTIDIAVEMMQLTLRIAGKTLFNTDLLSEAASLGTAFTTALRWATTQAEAPVPLPLSLPTPRNRHFQQAIRDLNRTVQRMITERRQTNATGHDVLAMLLHARDEATNQGMSDQEVRDQVMTLFLAGHETTANALAWTCYLLATHPMVYQQLQAEIDQILGNRSPTLADLPNLPYTLQVFKEALRLYPPVYVIARKVIEPIQLDRYTLTPDMHVGISPYVLHRRVAEFPNPEHFDPERWKPDAAQPRSAYLPFGAGPHTCLGNHFALMEGQLVLAVLTQQVHFRLVPGQQIEPEPLVTLRPKGGVKMIVHRR